MTQTQYQSLDFTGKGRTFIVGDIHGEFRKLDQGLIDIGFDPAQDNVVCVGDLVDRGPFSDEFESYLNKPWFYRVLGNHDLQPREFLLGYENAGNVSKNGGDWFLEKSPIEQERIALILENAPIAIHVITAGGNSVGVTHADMHPRWDHVEAQCQDPGQERYLVNLLTGSRKTITMVQRNPDLYPGEVRVYGVNHVFHGHHPTDEPLTFSNRTWLDTGACFGGPLTIIDVDDWLKPFKYHI